MLIKGIKSNMTLIIDHPQWESSRLPWDLRTIFDCELSIDDTYTLESGSVLQVGECQLHLVKD
jgi:hypothetical protein